jgi:hypothetical protein
MQRRSVDAGLGRHANRIRDGSPRGLNGNAVRVCGPKTRPDAAAAPATVSGETSATMSLGRLAREDGERATTREPGDLPSIVVTRGACRTGCVGRCW